MIERAPEPEARVRTLYTAAFRHPDFRWFITMRTLFIMGQQMQTVAVGWQIYDLTRRPIDLGYVGLVLFLPQVLLALPAGQVADRFDRRGVVIVAGLVAALCPLALLILSITNHIASAPVFGLLFLYGIARTFVGPATQSLLPQVVPREDFPNAMSWRSSTGQAATVGGPALGGFLFAFGADVVYAIVVGLTLLSVAAAVMLRSRSTRGVEGGANLKELLAGVRFVVSHSALLGASTLDLFAVLFGGAIGLLPVFARDILTMGPLGLGLLRSAPAAGSVLCALWLAGHPLKRRAGRSMFLCVAGFGAATIVFGLSRNFYLSMAALVCVGACDMVSVYVRQTIVQLSTPDTMRGRVNSVNLVFVGASNELGEFESGVTAAWFGTVPAVVLGGIGTLIVVALWVWRFPALRRIDRLEKLDSL